MYSSLECVPLAYEKFYIHFWSSQPLKHLGQKQEIHHASRQMIKCKDCKCGYLDRSWGVNSHGLLKNVTPLMSLNFCYDIQMVGLEFGVNNMTQEPSCLVSTVQASGAGIMVGDIFLAHFGPLSTSWASFKPHSLCVIADHVHLFIHSVSILRRLLSAG